MSNVIGSGAMANVTGKEPVVIENVNLIINVFNIGQGQGIGQIPSPATELLPNCLVGGSTVPAKDAVVGASYFLPKLKISDDKLPIGWIVCYNGVVIPVGIEPISTEIPTFGDLRTWKEIRVSLPPWFLTANETDLHCPSTACREKLPKNKSFEVHIKKHLGLPDTPNGNEGSLPCPLFYYCQDKACQYNGETGEKGFKAFKNVKQHYIKVHAPKLYVCDMCQKTFPTLQIVEAHKLMCGEKYSCSSCSASYNTLEVLQTHCRRKGHTYDHLKYKDKRNSVKQEIQSMKVVPPLAGKKKNRKLPVILPKPSNSDQVFNTIQALCRQAGVKVDYGCQTVCTAFLQKNNPVETVVGQSSSQFTQKKRKSTDTQTNIVKFRAACSDQRHNATNTNLDWKTVVTSDSQTQTADIGDSGDLSCEKGEDAAHFNDEFATISISETVPKLETVESIEEDLERTEVIRILETELIMKQDTNEASKYPVSKPTNPPVKVHNGPSVHQEFISFLEATDSATQTDPDMFDAWDEEWMGMYDSNLEDFPRVENNDYVSVSSTASQTAVENIASKSLSAEDYEALLNASDDRRFANLHSAFSEYIEGVTSSIMLDDSGNGGLGVGLSQTTNDLLLDWDNIVEEVYRDIDETAELFK